MNILQVCAYAAPYPGNFINSLLSLDNELKKNGHQTIYAFCDSAQNKSWCVELQKTKKVYFLPLRRARINPTTYFLMRQIIRCEKIDIAHSHFGLYDLPLAMIAPKSCRIFWHLHDPLERGKSFITDFLTKLQFSHFGKKAILLSVCDYYRNTAVDLGMKKENTKTIVNGIDLQRITYPYKKAKKEFDFLTFGWDFHRQGADIIFSAMNQLYRDGYRFKLLFNCLESTLEQVKLYFNRDIPVWLEIGKPVDDINHLFENSKMFIQASRSETFSYAVCEAAYAGLDVICSDIIGMEWAHSVPSVTFFESENIKQLYALLKKRLDNEQIIANNTIQTTRKIIVGNFSTHVWVRHIISEYGI